MAALSNARWVFEGSKDEWTAIATAQLGEWEIEVRWTRPDGVLGPHQQASEFKISPLASAGEGEAPGLTTVVLRDAQSVLAALNEQYPARYESEFPDSSPLAAVRAELGELRGKSPRQVADYYPRLLKAVNDFKGSGSRRPITDVAEFLGLSHATVKTQLRTAKRGLSEHRTDAELSS